MKVIIKGFGILLTIICLCLSWTFIFICTFGYNYLNLSLVGDEEIFINVNDEYFENGYKAQMFTGDVSELVSVTNSVDTKSVGVYQVNYKLSSVLGNIKKTRIVHVTDEEAPVIKLQGDLNVYLKQNEEFIETGYAVYDNVDKGLVHNVNITTNLDITKVGKYEIVYSVSDSSGNTTMASRMVEVIKHDLLTSEPKDFWFGDSYSDIIIKPEEKEFDFIKDMVIVGDSNIRYLYVKGKYLPAASVWGKDNLNAVELTTASMLIHENNSQMMMDDALNKYQPKYLVVSFGFGSVMNLSKTTFIKYAETFIENVKNNYPNTKMLVVSLLPIATDTMYSGLQNKTNQFNYYLVELCLKHKLSFINIADELKGNDGYGDPKYFLCYAEYDCGFHLNDEGKELYVNYLKNIDMSKEIK